MASPSVTHTFVNGTAIDATQVNTNFTDLINSLTDGTKDLSISALTCAGNVNMNGNVTLGNASGDDVTVTGSLASSIPIKTTYSYDIGSATLGARKIYFGSDDSAAFSTYLEAGTNSASYGLKLPDADGAASDYLKTDGSGQLAFVGGAGINNYSTTQTVTTADKVVTVTTGSAWTLTLYAASGNAGRTIEIIKTSSDANVLTIDGNSAETINGASEVTISRQYERIKLLCDGSNWLIQDRYIPLTKPARVHTNNSTAVANTTQTFIGFATTDFDPDSLFTNVGSANSTTYTSTTYWSCPTGKAGRYRVTGAIHVADSDWDSDEELRLQICVDGVVVRTVRNDAFGSLSSPLYTPIITDILDISEGEDISIGMYHQAGTDVSFNATSNFSWFTVEEVLVNT